MPLFATVGSDIVPSSVSATVSSTFDPVNGYSVTFQWTTLHPGNSIVIIENPVDYTVNNNTPIRQVVQNDMTTNHVVVVDHFPAYSEFATWGYYVASQIELVHCNARQVVCNAWSTYPGPATGACGSPPAPGCGGYYLTFTMRTSPTNPTGPLAFTMWPIGAQNVYQGDPSQGPACTPTSKNSRECNDLYFALQPNLMSGPPDALVIMQNVVITNLDTGGQVTDNSITAQYLCDFTAPSNPPPQDWDGNYSSDNVCYNGTIYSINTTVRLRVNSQAVPGHYQFTASFQAQENGSNDGNPVPVTYNFTVLPTASFVPTPPTVFPAIPGLATWQSNMVNPATTSAEFWCTNNTDTNPWWSLDNGNFSGYFDLPSSIYFEAWNYDGGRVYQQVADYDYNVAGMPGYHDVAERDHWKRCAGLAMEPYKDSLIGAKGSFVAEPNQFAYGLGMYFMRTGDSSAQNAVEILAHNPAWNHYFAGSPYEASLRATAYLLDDRLAAEILGEPRDNAFLLRTVDVLLGYLDQSYNLSLSNPNQQEYDINLFELGLVMESLTTYYELDLAEGNTPDARIPLEIKKTLDWLESSEYIPSTHLFVFQVYDVPRNPALVSGTLYQASSLNNLIATAFAWYWSKTNNSTYLNEGDDLFRHVFDDAGWTWSVKEFNQVYKWSFDYVRWRSGHNPDGSSPAVETVLAAANPCENNANPCNAPWTDYNPPVQFEWWPGNGSGPPSIYPTTVPAPGVTATTATFWLNTFKPNTTLAVYYGTAAPGYCNTYDPQPPNCMQPFPNFGFQQMLTANYAYQSTTTMGFQDQTALSQGITNIYDETVTITGLSPNTTYHWRPLTTDASGNMAAFHDQTFTTASQ
ncbi:MAG TPA: hypothetical protein VL240_09150 [Candidatus Binatia bacterium]|nr:hypothetical protein [Candidatus Binatia bacterium]